MKEEANSTVQTENRRLAAIMFTDIVGFSCQMGANEARTLRLLEIHNQIIQHAVAVHHGTIIKTVGDAFLVDFPSVVHAVQCAQAIQAQLRTHNADKEPTEQIHVRIGIHSGDIVQRDGDVFGDGVNIASRLQGLAEPDSICLSQIVYQEVEKKLSLGKVVSLGQPKLKNIEQRLSVYLLFSEHAGGVRHVLPAQGHLIRRGGTTHRNWVVAVVGLLLIAGAFRALWSLSRPTFTPQNLALVTQTEPVLPLPNKPSIAVMPFTNMSGDPEQEYFSDGLTDDLITDLSRLSTLFVIARNSTFTYKGKAVKVQEVSKELGVRYVLEGSVRKMEGQVRINAQLVDATTGHHVWVERYDRPLQNIFALQDEVVQKIVTTLKLQLTLQEQGYIVRKHTDNLEAYDYFLRGQEYFWRVTKEANAQARQMCEKAVALDPQYAEAYERLGWTYLLESFYRWSPAPQNLERALELAQKALALDDSLPTAHGLLSWVYILKQQPEQAITEGERAIALDPNNADSYDRQALVLISVGRPEEAIRSVEQAMRLNPHYPPLYLQRLGWAYLDVGRYAEAIIALKQVLLWNPNYVLAYTLLAASYGLQWISQLSQDPETLAQALAMAQKAIALNASVSWTHMGLGYVYLRQKQYDQALAEMERAIALDPNFALSYEGLAAVLSSVGRSEEAVESVEKALRLDPSRVDQNSFDLGSAYSSAGRLEEAVAPLKRYLTRYPNILGAHLILAAVYSELGKDTEARAEAAEVLRLNPKFSLEVHKERAPIKDLAMLERHIAALRKAGLK